jgi:hypothetical protein
LPQVAERALSQAAAGLDVYFVGNAPVAHHALPDATLFFLRASYLGGGMQPSERSGIAGATTLQRAPLHLLCAKRDSQNVPLSGLADWAWITKDEVPAFLGQELHAVMSQAL